MWFKQKDTSNKQDSSKMNCQLQLASINSNGVALAMPELLHYQNKTALIDLSARKNIHGQMSGNYLSRNKGRGMEFDEVRHYQTGDDIRAIDWRVTARTGKTHTKLFREELERPVLIATDLSASMHFGSQLLFKSVQAAHVAALVAWHAKNRGDRLGGIVFNQNEHLELKPRSRKEGVLHYLHALTSLHLSQHTSQHQPLSKDNSNHNANNSSSSSSNNLSYFSENCARVRQIAKPGSLVYLITDAQPIKDMLIQNAEQQTALSQESSALRHLTQISQHCELVVCLITDPLEQELPTSAVKLNVTLTDGNNRQQLTLGDKDTATNYKQQAETVFEQCSKLLTKAGARVISFSAGQTLEQQVKEGALFCNQ
ncbi:DUF58 domain-containing protein [Candidatus Colwellia aromaticivorans]|uniref:DUF58 domain-containing protein n=1 Tax=Candidatus Colwellia aromaticivorans TaxID=2267621 RepID=UPI000DF38391|nr:DUF58 domain-containing protein [Candidatus Colwellia aromaticivorans]